MTKRIILFILLLITLQKTYSQVYRFKATTLSMTEKNSRGIWNKWKQPTDANLIVTLDTKKNRIIVYSQNIQLYEILQYIDEKETKTDRIASFVCKDNEGKNCNVAIITRKKQGYRIQLYVTYDNKIINYNIEKI